MSVEVRDLVRSDIPELIGIIRDPLVAENQYAQYDRLTIPYWEAVYFKQAARGMYHHRCSTILSDGSIVGYIAQLHRNDPRNRFVECGWDLAPSHWGKGIMAAALNLLFQSLFETQDLRAVGADCFTNNRRCIRVIEKLGFRPVPLGVLQRVGIAFRTQCLRRINRYRLEATDWRAARTTSLPGSG